MADSRFGAEHLPEPLSRLDETRARAVIEPQARLPLRRVRGSYAAAAGALQRKFVAMLGALLAP